MNRKETSLWLGRAMSTNEVTLRTVQQMLTIIAYQQQVIQALFEKTISENDARQAGPPLSELEEGSTEQVLKKIADIQEQLKPVLEAVDQACSTLENEIK
jgi:hypothetical protein